MLCGMLQASRWQHLQNKMIMVTDNEFDWTNLFARVHDTLWLIQYKDLILPV